MSILAENILRESYQILGRPSQGDLPYLDLLVLVKDVVRGRMVDLKTSGRNHTLTAGSWVIPTAREMGTTGFVGALDNFVPTKVEWRTLAESGVYPEPMPKTVEVVSFESLGPLYGIKTSSLDTYCAFYNGFRDIAFSDDVNTLQNRQYRIWYEDTADIVLEDISDAADLPELFITLCKYEAALVALDQIRNADPEWADRRERLRGQFTAQVGIWTMRFEKWQRTLWGNKKVQKHGVPSRYRAFR
jgi:hypothetical protein